MSLTKGNAILKIGASEITPITTLAWDGIQWDNEEITPIGTADKGRVFTSTLYSGGTLSFTMVPYASNNVQHAAVLAANISGDTTTFTLETPGGDFTFGGIVSAKMITNVDGVFGYDVSVMVSGEVTVA